MRTRRTIGRVSLVESLEKRSLLSVASFGYGTNTTGTFSFVKFTEESQSTFSTQFGSVAFDGTGSESGSVTQSSASDGVSRTGAISDTYSLGNDGYYQDTDMGGYVPVTGNMGVLARLNGSSNDTSLIMAVRQGSGMGNASATGQYNVVMWMGDNGPAFATGSGSASFNGAGAFSATLANVWQGQSTPSSTLDVGTFNFDYSVASNGNLTMKSGSLTGALRPDGQMFTFGNLPNPYGDTGIAIGVKQGSGMTNASALGRYQGVVMASGIDGGTRVFSTAAMWVDLNGAGGMTGSMWKTGQGQASGGWLNTNSFSGTYGIGSAGGLAISTNGETHNGFISADGSLVVMPMTSGSYENGIMVLVRAPIAGQTNSTVQMNGTTLNDTLTATASGTNLVINNGASEQTFPLASVSLITADGGDGNDTISINAAIPTSLTGGNGNDTIYGGTSADTIFGNGGDDLLYGRGGPDSMLGNLGNDSLYGNAGADTLFGSAGSDYLYGNAGADNLNGGDGTSDIHGSAGNDSIYGGGGTDVMYGNGGNDYINVGVSDLLVDSIDGGAGIDTVVAEAGDVVINAEVLA